MPSKELAYDVEPSVANYLVYVSFTSHGSWGGTVGGSLHLGATMTEDEAVMMTKFYKDRGDEFHEKYPSDTTHRYGYMKNNPDWWSRASA